MSTAEQGGTHPSTGQARSMRRRGLLALATAFVAGVAAKFTEVPVSAGSDGDVVLGSVANNATQQTGVLNSASAGNGPAIHGFRSPGAAALVPTTFDAGVVGQTFVTNAPGVYGKSANGSAGIGVHGTSNSGYGVYGDGVIGMHGQSTSGWAIEGLIPNTSSAANTIGVLGENYSTSTGGSPGNGGFGVYGYSHYGHGLVGAAGTAGGGAVVGSTNGVAGAYAGIMFGPFVVVGGAKSAAVANGDGSHTLVYCVESPESWFEDFGEARLECGRAYVALDPAFAAIVDLTRYHVFVTDHSGLHLSVTERTPQGFTVEARTALAALHDPQRETEIAGTFSWRLVARRKDIKAARLARIELPREPRRPGRAADPSPAAS